jgi:hypothetical protein
LRFASSAVWRTLRFSVSMVVVVALLVALAVEGGQIRRWIGVVQVEAHAAVVVLDGPVEVIPRCRVAACLECLVGKLFVAAAD